MIIQLNAEEMQNIVIAHLKNHIAGLGSIEGLNQRMGFVRGEYVCVVGISEEIPDGIFDGEDDDFTDHTFSDASDDSEESEDNSKDPREAKGENQNKKGSGNKRRRRTRAEIEADEAKQKEAESKQKDPPVEAAPVEATVETPVEAAETQTEAQTPSDEDMFATSAEDAAEQPTDDGEPPFNVEEAEPVVEATQEAVANPDDLFADAGATANPFADNNAEAVEEDALFSAEPVEQTKVVEQSEAGFSKPVENNPLDLFS